MFQSTRPRGARPIRCHILTYPFLFQSTRPRGARLRYTEIDNNIFQFQSTRPRGARRDFTLAPAFFCSFNPRAREGRDIRDNVYMPQGRLFQSTRPRGARRNGLCIGVRPDGFQSTRPRGARLFKRCYRIRKNSFNPRAREGRDRVSGSAVSLPNVSIHAPARGATNSTVYLNRFRGVSIHAPARGATTSKVIIRWA